MSHLADTLRALSLRLLLFAGMALLLFPPLDRLLMLLAGRPDRHPFITFAVLLLLSLLLTGLLIIQLQRRLRHNQVEQPLVSHSWPQVRVRLTRLNYRLESALFFPWQANRLYQRFYPRCLQAATRADAPDPVLLKLLENLLRLDDQSMVSEARRLLILHYARVDAIDPEALPALLHIYTTHPDLIVPCQAAIQNALRRYPRWRNLRSFDFMQAFPHPDFYGAITRRYAHLHDAPLGDSALLLQLLASPDCNRAFRRISRRKLQRLTQPTPEQVALLAELNQQLGPYFSERLKTGWRPAAAVLMHPRLLYGAGGILGLLLLFKLGSWLFSADGQPPVLPSSVGPVGIQEAAFTVQVMATRDSSFAVTEAARLTGEGFLTYVLPPRVNSTYFRVRSGLLATRTEADTLAQVLLRSKLISEFYVAPFDSSGIILPRAE